MPDILNAAVAENLKDRFSPARSHGPPVKFIKLFPADQMTWRVADVFSRQSRHCTIGQFYRLIGEPLLIPQLPVRTLR
jgi:hypothetical protein